MNVISFPVVKDENILGQKKFILYSIFVLEANCEYPTRIKDEDNIREALQNVKLTHLIMPS